MGCLALVRRRYVAPVKEEKSIEFIARNLYGAAKERWLEKWARWIDELIHRSVSYTHLTLPTN